MRIGFFSQYAEQSPTGMNKVFIGTQQSMRQLFPENEYYLLGRSDWLKLDLPAKDLIVDTHGLTNMNFLQDVYDFDVIHSHYRGFHVANRYKCAKLLTIHDMMPLTHPEWFTSAVTKWMDDAVRKCAYESDVILTVSEYTKQDVLEFFGIDESKVKVVYNGLFDPFRYEKNVNEFVYEKIKKNEYMLAVSALQTNKNQNGLIRAYCIFRERHPDCKVKLVFAGNKRNANAAEEELSKHPQFREDIIFPGYVANDELVWLYKNALAVPYVSFAEGFGLPILEGMAAGRAVIASNTTSMPEVGGDAVEYCDPYDVENIADSIEKVVLDKEYRHILEQKAMVQAKKFSFDRAAKETMDIYKELVR